MNSNYNPEKLTLKTDDGYFLEGYKIKNGSSGAIFFFQGLFSKVDYYWQEFLKPIVKKISLDLIALNYRAHGKSGGVYNEKKCYEDTNKAYECGNNKDIYLIAHSVGCNYAIKKISDSIFRFGEGEDFIKRLKKVVLISPHYSVFSSKGSIKNDLGLADRLITKYDKIKKKQVLGKLKFINERNISKIVLFGLNLKDSAGYIFKNRSLHPDIHSLSDLFCQKLGSKVYNIRNIIKHFNGEMQIDQCMYNLRPCYSGDSLNIPPILTVFGENDEVIGFNKDKKLLEDYVNKFLSVGECISFPQTGHGLEDPDDKKPFYLGRLEIRPRKEPLEKIISFLKE